jgi:hypothetical protein
MRARSWRWLQTRILGLLDERGTRLWRALQPKSDKQHEHVDDE